jgi:hypothetical protein
MVFIDPEKERKRESGGVEVPGLVEGARASLASEVRSVWYSVVGDATVNADPMVSPVELPIAFSATL